MRKLIAIALLLTVLLYALPALAEGDAADLSKPGEELIAADAFARENELMADTTEGEYVRHSYLRAAWVLDVAASREGMADSEYLPTLEKYYGDYTRVYMLDYAQVIGSDPMPSPMVFAVGEKLDGSLEQCSTFAQVRARTYQINWCTGAAIELVLDRTLAQAQAE